METEIPEEFIDRIAGQIFGTLRCDGVCNYFEKEDVRQETILTYLELKAAGKEIKPRYLFLIGHRRCLAAHFPSYGKDKYRLEYYDPAFMPPSPEKPPDIVYDEKMETSNTDKYLEMLKDAGVEIDDPQGIVFALWFMGMEYPEIYLTLKTAGFFQAGLRRITRDMHQAFRDIRRKTGLHQKVVRMLREKHVKKLRAENQSE